MSLITTDAKQSHVTDYLRESQTRSQVTYYCRGKPEQKPWHILLQKEARLEAITQITTAIVEATRHVDVLINITGSQCVRIECESEGDWRSHVTSQRLQMW